MIKYRGLDVNNWWLMVVKLEYTLAHTIGCVVFIDKFLALDVY